MIFRKKKLKEPQGKSCICQNKKCKKFGVPQPITNYCNSCGGKVIPGFCFTHSEPERGRLTLPDEQPVVPFYLLNKSPKERR